MTVLGALSARFLAAAEISTLLDPVSGVSLSPRYDPGTGAGGPFYMLLLNLLIFACGFAVYPVIKRYRRKQGVDIDLAFREVPPE